MRAVLSIAAIVTLAVTPVLAAASPPQPAPDAPLGVTLTLQEWQMLFSAVRIPDGLPGDVVRGIEAKLGEQLQRESRPPPLPARTEGVQR